MGNSYLRDIRQFSHWILFVVLLVFVYLWKGWCVCITIEIRRHLKATGSLLPPTESQGLNSGLYPLNHLSTLPFVFWWLPTVEISKWKQGLAFSWWWLSGVLILGGGTGKSSFRYCFSGVIPWDSPYLILEDRLSHGSGTHQLARLTSQWDAWTTSVVWEQGWKVLATTHGFLYMGFGHQTQVLMLPRPVLYPLSSLLSPSPRRFMLFLKARKCHHCSITYEWISYFTDLQKLQKRSFI